MKNKKFRISYPIAQDGQWIDPVHRGFKMRCCDCALTHTVNFKVVKGQVRMQCFRDERSTAAARRGKTKMVKR